MHKIRITKAPMQYGGTSAPITTSERDAWERMQSAGYQQGFLGDDHNRQPGVDFMQKYGVDPARLPAYQQDFQNMQGNNRVRSGVNGYSPVDNFFGDKTAQQRYTHYATEHYDSRGNLIPADSKNFGTDANAATAMVNSWNKPAAPQWQSNDQGIPMTSAAPATTAVQKYTSPNPSKQQQQENWHTDGPTDYSIDAVRSKFGGMPVKRIRVTHTPTSQIPENGLSPEMEMGGATRGYGMQQPGKGYALDRFWASPAGYPGSTSKVQPFAKIGSTLPESKDGGDINAEKAERVLGDFDQDGNLELMNVGGPSHAEGGKDVDVPSHSFVYSDTKDLKIKDAELLAMFDLKPKRGGYTPAEIAKKYDLNKYKATISDPNSDDLSKSTAQLMSDNYLGKLNKLAMIQEQMKKGMGMDHHDPGQQMARRGGMYQSGGLTYPPAPVPAHGSDWMPYDSDIAAAQGYTGDPSTVSYQKWANMHGAGLKEDNKMGAKTMSWRNPDAPIPSLPISGPTASGMGDPTADPYYSLVPYAPTTNTIVPPPVADTVAPQDKTKPPVQTVNGKPFRMNPNFYGNMENFLQMATLNRFHPYEPVPQAVIPDVVFGDPTRQAAALQERARDSNEMDAGTPQGRANALARQGVAGRDSADVIGNIHNQDIATANQGNAQAASITNELMAKQASRLAELNKAGFLADRDYQREMGRLKATFIDRFQKQHDTDVKTQWLNKVSPFFNINPVDQMPDFKSGNAKAEFEKMYGPNAGQSTPDQYKRAQSIYDQMLQNPMYQTDEGRKQAMIIAGREAGLRSSESETFKPGAMMPTMTYRGMSMGQSMPNTYGMGYPGMGYEMGGPLLKMGGKVDLYDGSKLKKFMK